MHSSCKLRQSRPRCVVHLNHVHSAWKVCQSLRDLVDLFGPTRSLHSINNIYNLYFHIYRLIRFFTFANKSLVPEAATITNLFFFLCALPERVDVKDRGRCDHTAEAGLSAAASQERLTVAGVLTDLERQRALHCPVLFVLAEGSFLKKKIKIK